MNYTNARADYYICPSTRPQTPGIEYRVSSIEYQESSIKYQTTYLLLGSNEGDRQQWLKQAMELISASCGPMIQASSIYSTAAWGIEAQPDFLNMAIAIDTELSPADLLQEIHNIEQKLGRQRVLKWGQRTLDIDILFYGNQIIDKPELKVPHPYIQDRRFALVPMDEIAAEFIHPVFKKTIAQLLADCPDTLQVHKAN